LPESFDELEVLVQGRYLLLLARDVARAAFGRQAHRDRDRFQHRRLAGAVFSHKKGDVGMKPHYVQVAYRRNGERIAAAIDLGSRIDHDLPQVRLGGQWHCDSRFKVNKKALPKQCSRKPAKQLRTCAARH
jgi:hypothetical protein